MMNFRRLSIFMELGFRLRRKIFLGFRSIFFGVFFSYWFFVEGEDYFDFVFFVFVIFMSVII